MRSMGACCRLTLAKSASEPKKEVCLRSVMCVNLAFCYRAFSQQQWELHLLYICYVGCCMSHNPSAASVRKLSRLDAAGNTC